MKPFTKRTDESIPDLLNNRKEHMNAVQDWLRKVDNKEAHTLFVYGTLMKGKLNHTAYMKNAKYLGEASIFGFGLYDLGRFPGIKHVDEPRLVLGELYDVDDYAYDEICLLEGNGSFYQSESVPAMLNDTGEWLPAKVFVFLGHVDEKYRIPGDIQVWKQ